MGQSTEKQEEKTDCNVKRNETHKGEEDSLKLNGITLKTQKKTDPTNEEKRRWKIRRKANANEDRKNVGNVDTNE